MRKVGEVLETEAEELDVIHKLLLENENAEDWQDSDEEEVELPFCPLTRISVNVCMTPAAKATPEVLALRDLAFRSGLTLSHWPHEFKVRGSRGVVGEDMPALTPKVNLALLHGSFCPAGFVKPKISPATAALITGEAPPDPDWGFLNPAGPETGAPRAPRP